MSFGQSLGPPASRRQIETLTELIHAAGHTDFRDARGPLGLTQRQAGGKFTRDEAETLIGQLEAEAEADSDGGQEAVPSAPPPARAVRKVQSGGTTPATADPRVPGDAKPITILRDVESELLAAELQRRGWVVLEP